MAAETGGAVERTKDQVDSEQLEALERIRVYIKSKTSYDVLPFSFRMIVLDTNLLVKKSLTVLLQNNIVSAPLWKSETSTFGGLLTSQDFINVIQYYYQKVIYQEALNEINSLKLESLREVEKRIGALPPETNYISPMATVFEACQMMVRSRARRIPLLDYDDETGREMIVSVLTQFRILKFIALNCKETQMLGKPLSELNIGTYENLATVDLETPVIEVIHIFFHRGISAVPILDDDGRVINIYEAVDVITLIGSGLYQDLDLTVGQALLRRPDDFPGVRTCQEEDTVSAIFEVIRKSRVHRLIIVDDENHLRGILTLSDILAYIVDEALPGIN